MNFIAKLIGMILQVTLNLFAGVKQKVESVEIKETGDRVRQSYEAFGEKIKEGREEMGYTRPKKEKEAPRCPRTKRSLC